MYGRYFGSRPGFWPSLAIFRGSTRLRVARIFIPIDGPFTVNAFGSGILEFVLDFFDVLGNLPEVLGGDAGLGFDCVQALMTVEMERWQRLETLRTLNSSLQYKRKTVRTEGG